MFSDFPFRIFFMLCFALLGREKILQYLHPYAFMYIRKWRNVFALRNLPRHGLRLQPLSIQLMFSDFVRRRSDVTKPWESASPQELVRKICTPPHLPRTLLSLQSVIGTLHFICHLVWMLSCTLNNGNGIWDHLCSQGRITFCIILILILLLISAINF